jgi:CPA2 family monovalent cation:H+ antiporter-2
MEVGLAREFFFVLLAALVGGVTVRFIKLQPIIGYIIAGIVFGSILPIAGTEIEKLAEIGAILLLFSIGIELSFKRLGRVLKPAVIGATLQMAVVGLLSFFALSILGIGSNAAVVLSMGFALSSTAVVVKLLSDRGETETLHGELMIGWLLVQDLAVIPMMVVLPLLAGGGSSGLMAEGARALGVATVVVAATVFLGKTVAPFVIHQVASTNSRELLIVSAVALALGTAALTSYFGISPILGAFLAGVVISESQENHAVFAETRPLRDLFVALFFVTMGFLVSPNIIVSKFGLILGLTAMVMVLKGFVILLLNFGLGYYGKSAIATSLGLTQIGEFSFIIFSSARALNLISAEIASIGIATTLFSLITTPMMFKSIVPLWRKLRDKSTGFDFLHQRLVGWKRSSSEDISPYKGHIILCGFGRVGSWVGKEMDDLKIPYVVVDYNQSAIQKARLGGLDVIYGDPAEAEVLDKANLREAKAIIVAIPDRVAQEEIVAYVQSVSPKTKIISRVHLDEDYTKMRSLKVDKIVQPEFEAAIAMIRTILVSMGKSKADIAERIRKLRLSRAVT